MEQLGKLQKNKCRSVGSNPPLSLIVRPEQSTYYNAPKRKRFQKEKAPHTRGTKKLDPRKPKPSKAWEAYLGLRGYHNLAVETGETEKSICSGLPSKAKVAPKASPGSCTRMVLLAGV